MLLSERVKADGLRIETRHVRDFDIPFSSPNFPIRRARWQVELHYRDETPLTLDDWECAAGEEPTVLDVMGVLISDCNRISLADDYEEWASEFDANPSQWPPRETYDAWCKLAWELRVMLGHHLYEDYIFRTERDD